MDLYPDVERLHGDRDGGLAPLRGRRWDAVIDTSGFVPRLVRASAELLTSAVERYVFVSTVSVYRDLAEPGVDEDAPVGTLDDAATEDVTGATYGPLKALCERAAEEAMPGRVLTLRLGLIVGPYDPTDRFTYWPRRRRAAAHCWRPRPRGDPSRSSTCATLPGGRYAWWSARRRAPTTRSGRTISSRSARSSMSASRWAAPTRALCGWTSSAGHETG